MYTAHMLNSGGMASSAGNVWSRSYRAGSESYGLLKQERLGADPIGQEVRVMAF